jgi:hypothetical protein
MLEVHVMPWDKSTPDRWSRVSHVHVLDSMKKQIGIHVPANGLEEIPVAIKKALRKAGYKISEGDIRK